MNGISERNPFVGPRPIQQGETLHGRDGEVSELYNRLQARRIVVLHSPSGAGKSSLVMAGLMPRLLANNFDVWRPIRVNLDSAAFEGLPASSNRHLLSALVSLEDELPVERRRSLAELAELDFLEYLQQRPRRKGMAGRPVVLLFDQFEELLTIDPLAIEAKREFCRSIGRALDDPHYWALFIIREDYLAAFADYRELIPTHMSTTFRLDLLGRDGARQAALNLAAAGGRAFPAVDKLVSDLSTVHVQQADGSLVARQGLHIEPVYLQVVCRRLWDAMPVNDLSIDEDDIDAYAGVSTSLADYYAHAVHSIAGDNVAVERSLRDWIGSKLIVGGIRSQVRQGPGSSGGLDNGLIDQLLGTYLVRAEIRAGTNWFELSHDRLVEPIQDSNERWEQAHLHVLQVQAKLWEHGGRARGLLLDADGLPAAIAWARANPQLVTDSEQEFLQQSITLRAEQARQRRAQRTFTAALAVVAVVALVLGGTAWRLRGTAEQREREAQVAAADAEEQREHARHEQGQANQLRLEAEHEREKATLSQRKAQRETKKAEKMLRQMFAIVLRPFIQGGSISGEIAVSEGWIPLLEHGGRCFAAANFVHNGGRIIAAGHDEILADVDGQGTARFLELTLESLLDNQTKRGVGIVTQRSGSYERLQTLRKNLGALQYQHKLDVSLGDLADDPDVGVLIVDNRWQDEFTSEEIAGVEAFVRNGGGLLAVGRGREWIDHQPEPGSPAPTLASYPMNQLLAPFGVSWTAAQIDSKDLQIKAEEAMVEFNNQAKVRVDIATREQGYEAYFTTLEPGEALRVQSSIAQEWVGRSALDNHVIGTAKIEWTRQTITISESKLESKQVAEPKHRSNSRPTKALEPPTSEPGGNEPPPSPPVQTPVQTTPAPSLTSVCNRWRSVGLLYINDIDCRDYHDKLKKRGTYDSKAKCAVNSYSEPALIDCYDDVSSYTTESVEELEPEPEPEPVAAQIPSVASVCKKWGSFGLISVDDMSCAEYQQHLKAMGDYEAHARCVVGARSEAAFDECPF